jgi:hypothetical protein
MSDFFRAMRRAWIVGRAEFTRAMWQAKRRRQLRNNAEEF